MSKPRLLPAASATTMLLVMAVLAALLASPAQAAVTSTTVTDSPGDTFIYATRAYNKAPATVKAASEIDRATFSFDTGVKKVFIKVRTPLPTVVPDGYKITSFVSVNNGGDPVPEPGRTTAARRAALVQLITGTVTFTGSSAKLTGRVCKAGADSAVKLTSFSTAEDSFVISAPASCLGKTRKVHGNASTRTFKGRTLLTLDGTPSPALDR